MLFLTNLKEILRAYLSLGTLHVNLLVKDLNKGAYKTNWILLSQRWKLLDELA